MKMNYEISTTLTVRNVAFVQLWQEIARSAQSNGYEKHYMRFNRAILTSLLLGVVCVHLFSVVAQEAFPGDTSTETFVSENHNNLVKIFGGNVIVGNAERLNDAVVIGGNAEINGIVDHDVVIIGGNLVLNAPVRGDVVVIGGKALIKNMASVGGDLVTIGAENEIESAVAVHGDKVIIAPWAGGTVESLKAYFEKCLLKGRFFALDLPWTIMILGALVLLMIICALIFSNVFTKSIAVVEKRILSALLIGILIPVAIGPIFIALAITVIGIPAIPALIITLKGAMMIGIFAICAHIGKQILSLFKASVNLSPIVFALIGCVLIAAVMVQPFIGGFISVVIATIGVGAAVIAIYETIRNSCDNRQAVQTVISNTGTGVKNDMPECKAETVSLQEAGRTVETDAVHTPATFLQRAGAAVIDCILLMIILDIIFKPFSGNCMGSMGHDLCGSINFTALLIYCVSMWTWKQTTIGMIIFGLKIYRSDYKPLTFGVALIRGLGLILSIVPIGLGFLWIIWDEQRQGWHDKIAGTVVCKAPGKCL